MSTHKFVQKKYTTILFILLYLFATLFPVNTVSAQLPVRDCEESSAQVASAAAVAAPDASQQVMVADSAVNFAVFQTQWLSKFKDRFLLREFFVEMLLTHDRYEIRSEFYDEFRTRFEKAMEESGTEGDSPAAYDDYIYTLFEIGLEMPQFAPLMPGVWNKMNQFNITYFGDNALKVAGSVDRYPLTERMLAIAPEIMSRVYTCAQKDPVFASEFDRLFHDALEVSITDSAKTILDQNPDLPVPTAIKDRIAEDGTLTISLDELEEITKGEFAKLHTTIDEMQETLSEIDAQQDVIVDYIKDQELKAKHQELIKKKAAAFQLKIDAAKASVSILSTIIGQIDAKYGKRVAVIGTSGIQVAEAMNTWLKSISGFSDVFSLNSVIMSGSVLGAVMNIVALFGEQEPTPEQMILEEIGKLRQQVDQLRLEMHDRFDRIDEGLNAIFTTMHDRFNQIDIQLGQINGNIRDVQQSLLTLDVKLSRIERNNFELISAVGRRPLLDAINIGLGYQRRTGAEMPYQPDFVNYEGIFHGWGTIHAFDAGNVGPTQRDYSDSGLYAELSAYPLDANLNYLNGWLMAHGLQPLSERPLASPRDWLFASRAYSQLGLEWPEHMRQVDPEQQAMLDQVGFELEQAMQKITTIQTPNGPQGNTLLFSTVITHYQNKLENLDSAIQAVETDFVNEKRTLELQRAEPFNLYGGVNQPLTYVPVGLTKITCNGADAVAPSGLSAKIPNFNVYNLADYLHQGNLSVCVQYEMGDYYDVCYNEPEPPYAERCDRYYEARAILNVYFDGVSIMSQTLSNGFGYLSPDWALHYEKLMPRWTEGDNFKAKFEAMATIDEPTPEVSAQRAAMLATVTDKVETVLATYQRQMYQRILHEMTAGSLKTAATEAAGGKLLIDSFVTLGFQRAVNSDEFLHAMLYGNQQLVDDSQIMQSYAISMTQPISETNLLVNPRLTIAEAADERGAAFAELVNTHLDAITAKEYAETPDYIAGTRRELDLTMRIAQIEVSETPTPTPPVTPEPGVTPQPGVTPTPPGPQSADPKAIYMPLIDR